MPILVKNIQIVFVYRHCLFGDWKEGPGTPGKPERKMTTTRQAKRIARVAQEIDANLEAVRREERLG